jgi:hypothetical protein
VARFVNPKNQAERLHNELEVERAVSLHLRDTLDDVEAGLRLWKESAMMASTWSREDEALLRWLEGGEHAVRV